MSSIRNLYNRTLSEEKRYWIYKQLHRKEIEALKYQVHPSSKGDFSLRHFYGNECIFIHITKSAGTSLALSLFGELPYHYTAQQYRVIYGRKDFNRFFKFTFVRNPWDRLYSAYSYLKGGGWDENDKKWAALNLVEVNSFSDFVLKWFSTEKLMSHIHFWPQSKFICDKNDKPIIDYLGYFENLSDDFSHVIKTMNLPEKTLKHTNSSKRVSYREVYTQEMIGKIAHIYKQDIDNFGYTFDGYTPTQVLNNKFVR